MEALIKLKNKLCFKELNNNQSVIFDFSSLDTISFLKSHYLLHKKAYAQHLGY
jgi:hypothetical protein